MKKLGRIQTFAVAGLSALALATPLALAQTAGGEQGQGTNAERHGKGGHRGGRGGDFGGRRGGHRGGGGMFRGIELTDAQKASLKQLGQSFVRPSRARRSTRRWRRRSFRSPRRFRPS